MPKSNLSDLLCIARRCLPSMSTDGQVFVRVDEPSAGGSLVFPVRSPGFRHWFFYRSSVEFGSFPTSQAFHLILYHLEAQAYYASPNEQCITEGEVRQSFAPPSPPTAEEAVRSLLARQPRWCGTASELFRLLSPLAFCASPKVLSEQVRKAAPSLDGRHNITATFHRSNGVSRIHLSLESGAELSEVPASESAALSQPSENNADCRRLTKNAATPGLRHPKIST